MSSRSHKYTRAPSATRGFRGGSRRNSPRAPRRDPPRRFPDRSAGTHGSTRPRLLLPSPTSLRRPNAKPSRRSSRIRRPGRRQRRGDRDSARCVHRRRADGRHDRLPRVLNRMKKSVTLAVGPAVDRFPCLFASVRSNRARHGRRADCRRWKPPRFSNPVVHESCRHTRIRAEDNGHNAARLS